VKQAILDKTNRLANDLYAFLRDIIRIRSYDAHEGKVIERIRQEMETLGFDKIEIDPMGNLLGFMGTGKRLIAFDGHCDTVTHGDLSNWTFDPFEGMEDDQVIGGLGSTDQKGGIAAMLYAGRIMKDLDLLDDITVVMSASVQEEDYDGLCWKYIIEEDGIRPEFVVLTEPCDWMIRNGQRGRMELKITTKGLSAHGSTPQLGDNAVYKMQPIIGAIERLNERMTDDGLLGKGSITISEILSTAPSRCAVADSCTITLDRRTNSLETKEFVLEQLRSLPEVITAGAEVALYHDGTPSWKNLLYESEKFYPAWVIETEHPLCQATTRAYEDLFDRKALVKPWHFSTNGVSIMGLHGIPCIGFGPGHTELAHKPNEKTWKQELLASCALYAYLPVTYFLS